VEEKEKEKEKERRGGWLYDIMKVMRKTEQ
jgi:hypothetical protein